MVSKNASTVKIKGLECFEKENIDKLNQIIEGQKWGQLEQKSRKSILSLRHSILMLRRSKEFDELRQEKISGNNNKEKKKSCIDSLKLEHHQSQQYMQQIAKQDSKTAISEAFKSKFSKLKTIKIDNKLSSPSLLINEMQQQQQKNKPFNKQSQDFSEEVNEQKFQQNLKKKRIREEIKSVDYTSQKSTPKNNCNNVQPSLFEEKHVMKSSMQKQKTKSLFHTLKEQQSITNSTPPVSNQTKNRSTQQEQQQQMYKSQQFFSTTMHSQQNSQSKFKDQTCKVSNSIIKEVKFDNKLLLLSPTPNLTNVLSQNYFNNASNIKKNNNQGQKDDELMDLKQIKLIRKHHHYSNVSNSKNSANSLKRIKEQEMNKKQQQQLEQRLKEQREVILKVKKHLEERKKNQKRLQELIEKELEEEMFLESEIDQSYDEKFNERIGTEINQGFKKGQNVNEQRPSNKLKRKFRRRTVIRFNANKYQILKNEFSVLKNQK